MLHRILRYSKMFMAKHGISRSSVDDDIETVFWTSADLDNALFEYEERGSKPRRRETVPEGPTQCYEPIDEMTEHPVQEQHAKWLYKKFDLTGAIDCPITDKFRNLLDGAMKPLLEHPCWQPFRHAVTAAAEANRIDNIVSLGLCTVFGADFALQIGKNGNEQVVYDFIAELALLFAAREIIESHYRARILASPELTQGRPPSAPEQDEHIRIVFQDPLFRLANLRLLQALGGIVVWPNHAHRFIKESTFLFAKHVPRDVIWDIALRGPLPAMYFGGNISDTRGGAMAEAYFEGNFDEMEGIRCVSEEFLTSRDSLALDGMHGLLNNQSLYWRKKSDDGAVMSGRTGAG